MLERLLHRNRNREAEDSYSPYVNIEGFNAGAVREMEDYYIRLGYMTEDDRMKIPEEIEFSNMSPSADHD